MVMIRHEISRNAHGGSELVSRELERILRRQRPGLDDCVAIHVSRFQALIADRANILWIHDMAGDPMYAHLREDGGQAFDALVFVSHWQYQEFLRTYDLQARRIAVIPNGGFPLDDSYSDKWRASDLGSESNPVRLIYFTTPHRGLEILLSLFDALYRDFFAQGVHIHLDIYSSFQIYGWAHKDAPYRVLFDYCESHPAITYHGTVQHSDVIATLKTQHIFAFPSLWPETFCCCLAEAMFARSWVVHSDLGALPETSGGLTQSYPFIADREAHAAVFSRQLSQAISMCIHDRGHVIARTTMAAERAKLLYSWDAVAPQWTALLDLAKQPSFTQGMLSP
jgi:glycosyltransferase involved in cell wall biosynthesis